MWGTQITLAEQLTVRFSLHLCYPKLSYHLMTSVFSNHDIQYNMYVNHARDPLFLQECNYIVSNKTWKGPTSFKTQWVLPRQRGGIPSSWNMLTSLCGWTVDNRRGESVQTEKKTKFLTHNYQSQWDIFYCFLQLWPRLKVCILSSW